MLASSKSNEVTVVGVLPEECRAPFWPLQWWSLGDSEADHIIVPLDEDYKETYALGLCMDTTNRVPPNGPAAASSSSSSSGSNSGLFPAIFMLSTDARLHAYHFTTTFAPHVAALQGMMQPAQPVLSIEQARQKRQFFSNMQVLQQARAGEEQEQEGEEDDVDSNAGQAEDEEEEENAVTPPHAFSTPPPNASLAEPQATAATTSAFSFKPAEQAPAAAATTAPFSFNAPAPSAFGAAFGAAAFGSSAFATAAPSAFGAGDKAAPFSFSFAPAAAAPAATAAPVVAAAPAATAAPSFGGFSFAAPTSATATSFGSAPSFGAAFGAAAPTSVFGAAAAPVPAKPTPAASPKLTSQPAPAFSMPPPAVTVAVAAPALARSTNANVAVKNNLEFSTPSPSASAATLPPFQPTPLAVAMPPAARATLAQPTATTGSMTRSIIKPAVAAAPAPAHVFPPSSSTGPYAPSKFGIEYDQPAEVDAAELAPRPKKATAVNPKLIEVSEALGTGTEKKFMEALLTVAIKFKNLAQMAHESRESIVAVQYAPAKPAPGQAATFSVKAMRTLTSRTRTLMGVANTLQEAEVKSRTTIEELVAQSKRDDLVAATCGSMLQREKDPQYQQLLQSMPLDVQSSRLQQSIDANTAEVQRQITHLQSHLQELYMHHQASPMRGGRPSVVSVPTVKSVVDVINKHGKSIEEMEDEMDELKEQIDSMQLHPSLPLNKGGRRTKARMLAQRQQRLGGGGGGGRGGFDQIGGGNFSPIGRASGTSSGVMTPVDSKSAQGGRFLIGGSPAPRLLREASSPPFSAAPSASSSSVFNQSDAGALPSLSLRPSLSREASLAAISRGKSKQRLDQLFAQMDQLQLHAATITPLAAHPEEEEEQQHHQSLSSSRLVSESANTRRWARSAQRQAAAPVSPLRHPLARTNDAARTSSDEEEESKPSIGRNNMPEQQAPVLKREPTRAAADGQTLLELQNEALLARVDMLMAELKMEKERSAAAKSAPQPPAAKPVSAFASAALPPPVAVAAAAPAAAAPTTSAFGSSFGSSFGGGSSFALPASSPFGAAESAAAPAPSFAFGGLADAAAAAPPAAVEVKPKLKAKEKAKIAFEAATAAAAAPATAAAAPTSSFGSFASFGSTPAPAASFAFGGGFGLPAPAGSRRCG